MNHRFGRHFSLITKQVLFVAAALLVVQSAFSQVGSVENLIYQGRIANGGVALNSGVTTFEVSIFGGASNCLLYQEIFSKDMTGTSGHYSFNIGSGTRTDTLFGGGAPTHSLSDVLRNIGTINTLNCNGSSGSFSPALTNDRRFQLRFNNAGSGWVSLPNQAIKAAPYAIQAMQINGYGVSNLAKISGASTEVVTPAGWARLKNAGDTGIFTFSDDNSTSCAVALTGGLRYNAGNLQLCNGTTWVTLSTGGSAINALTGDVTASGTGSVAATIATGAVNSTKILDGTIATADIADGAITAVKINDATITAAKLNQMSATTGQVLKWNGTVWAPAADDNTSTPADASYAAKGIVQFQTDAATSGITVAAGVARLANSGATAGSYGSATQVPAITVDAFGRITAVTATTIAVPASAVSSGTLNISQGGTGASSLTANRMVLVNGTGTALTNDVCALNQLLQYNGTQWVCVAATSLGTPNAVVNGGNSYAGTMTVGTNDNNELRFETNGTDKMTVLANGNVGIGTTAPTVMLDVAGAGRFATTGAGLTTITSTASSNSIAMNVSSDSGRALSAYSASGVGIYSSTGGVTNAIQGVTNNGGFALIGQATANSSTNMAVGVYGSVANNPANNIGYAVQAVNNSPTGWGLYSSGSSPNYFAGNVGLGTTTPFELLDVNGGLRTGRAPASLTTTSGSHGATDTTINVSSTTGYPTSGTLRIGNEALRYTGTTSTSFTGVTRAQLGTTAGSITAGTSVDNYTFIAGSTGAIPTMVSTSSGNVGIGTSQPAANLHLPGSSSFRVGESNFNLGSFASVESTLGANVNGVNLRLSRVGNDWNTPATVSFETGGAVAYSMGLLRSAGGNLSIGTNSNDSSPAISINSSKQIAFGFNAPSARLHQDQGNATATYHKFTAGTTTNQASTDGFDVGISATGDAELRQRENLNMNFFTSNTQQMTIQAGGNVGIGTASPAQKLDVAGAIRSSTGGFVFPDGTVATTAITSATSGGTSTTDVTFAADTDMNGTGDVSFGTGGADRLRITNAGEIGIGTGTPAAKMEIVGTTTNSTASGLRVNDSSGNPTLIARNDGFLGVGVAPTSRITMPGNSVITFNGFSAQNRPVTFGAQSDDSAFLDFGAGSGKLFTIKDGGTNLAVFRANSSGHDINGTLNVNTPNSGGWTAVARFFAPSIVTGNNASIAIGRDSSSNNNSEFRFYYAGNGSTLNRTDFGFSGNATPAMSILANLNVGIGTTAPTAKLEVLNGNFRITQNPDGAEIQVGGGPRLVLGTNTTVNQFLEFGAYNSVNNLDTKSRDFNIFSTSIASGMTFKANTGFVGIGTTSPGAKLDVLGGQVRSVNSLGNSEDNVTSNVNWHNGNSQSMSTACTSTSFTNMLDGGTYALAVTETTATTCVFSQAGLTFLYSPANGPRTAGRHTLYNFQRIGNNVYVSWRAGFQ